MKIVIKILLLNTFVSFAQPKFKAYKDYFGNDLILFNDSTFIHTWNYDLNSIWESGSWRKCGDTLFFTPRPIFDTVNCGTGDSIIRSTDRKANRISCDSLPSRHGWSVSQRDSLFSFKLIDKQNKLYEIGKYGKIIKSTHGKNQRVSVRNKRLDKSPIVLYNRTKKIPAYYYLLTK